MSDVTRAQFSPDHQAVATGSDDGTVSLWDATSGDPIVAFDHGASQLDGPKALRLHDPTRRELNSIPEMS